MSQNKSVEEVVEALNEEFMAIIKRFAPNHYAHLIDQEREREIVEKILHSYSPDDTINDYQDKIKEISEKYNITLTNPNKD